MRPVRNLVLLLGALAAVSFASRETMESSLILDGLERRLVVIVDMEPDDRVALMLLATGFPNELVLVTTSGIQARRTAKPASQLLEQLGLAGIPVIPGNGGAEGPYSALQGVLTSHDDTEIVLLAPATDLVATLEQNPALKTKIKHVHVMGGWSRAELPSGEVERRTTYNWNTDPDAAVKLMSARTIPMTLYSSDMIKLSFSGGSINSENFPAIIDELVNQPCQVPAFQSFLSAAESWDQQLVETNPRIKVVIGDHAGRQFTPADPAVVVGVVNADFITGKRRVGISIDLGDGDSSRGFKIKLVDDESSTISLVEAVDPEVFRQQVLHGLKRIAAKSCQ